MLNLSNDWNDIISNFQIVSSPLVFSRVRIARSVLFCVVFCRSLFGIKSLFCWPLQCLSFYLRFLKIPWVFSSFSWKHLNYPDLRTRSISSFFLTIKWNKLLTLEIINDFPRVPWGHIKLKIEALLLDIQSQ